MFEDLECDLSLRVSLSRIHLFLFLPRVAFICQSALSAFKLAPHCVHLGGNGSLSRYLPSLLNASEHYVGAMGSAGGG